MTYETIVVVVGVIEILTGFVIIYWGIKMCQPCGEYK